MAPSRAAPLPAPFTIEPVLSEPSPHPLRALAALPPSHLLASSTDGNLTLLGPTDGVLQPEHVYDPSPTRKAIDRLVVLETVAKVIVLSEGVLSFHALPSMQIQSAGAAAATVGISNLVKGVSTFAVDDPTSSTVRIAVARKKAVSLYAVTRNGVEAIKDLPLAQPIYLAAFRAHALCVADRDKYSIIDTRAGEQIPLLPISQDAAHQDSAQPVALAAPAIVAVGQAEFLVASHTGDSSLGLFVKHSGEPCRGTIEWSSRVRSLAVEDAPVGQTNVDRGYVLALLRNNTIQIHSLGDTASILQTLSLDPHEIPDPRSLVSFHDRGLDLTGTGATSTGPSALLERTSIPLLTPSAPLDLPPATPPHRHIRRASSMRSTTASKRHLSPAHTVLLCKHTLLAIQPLTPLVQAEALLNRGRAADSLALTESASMPSETARYIHLRAGLIYLGETKFEEAGVCLARACLRRYSKAETIRSLYVDPRIVLRMWPDLRGGLIGSEDKVEVWRGAEDAVREAERSIDSIVLADLYRNYSPHIAPDIERAEATSGLRKQLLEEARAMTKRLLEEWRADWTGSMRDAGRREQSVDTALAKLYAEEDDLEAVLALVTADRAHVVLGELKPWLAERQLDVALARVLVHEGEYAQAVAIWTRLYEAAVPPKSPPASLTEIADLLQRVTDPEALRKYGLWFLTRHRSTGLKVLASLPQDSPAGTRELLDSVRNIEASAADELLESLVLLRKSSDVSLQTSVVARQLDHLVDLCRPVDVRDALKRQELDYQAAQLPNGFLDYLLTLPETELLQSRLRLILFLHAIPDYDANDLRDRLDKIVELSVERVLVYGRLKLHRQALATLVLTLGDMSSAEAYCHHYGTPLSPSQVAKLARQLDLTLPPVKQPRRRTTLNRIAVDARSELFQMLVDICLTPRDQSSIVTRELTVQLITKQAVHLSLNDILSRVPDEWRAADMAPICTRALRRGLDERYELMILKALASGRNIEVGERAYELQKRAGPIPAKAGDLVSLTTSPVREVRVEKVEKMAGLATDALLEKGRATVVEGETADLR